MVVSTHRPLPQEIRDIQRELEETCAGYGLDFFETIFEMVDYEEMSMLAAYGGFPTRYPHWKFGAQFDELMKGYSYGLQKIYEMVINTDPCYAYLLRANELTDQKLVIAHVYAHCDFFKNNAWFAHTNRRMLDEMANHATRVNRYVDRFGYDEVEQFIDTCLSLENLIDPYWPHMSRASDVKQKSPPGFAANGSDGETVDSQGRFPSKDYMDSFINPPDVLEQEETDRRQQREEQEESRSFPAEPWRDVLLFLLEYAPLKDWQRDILAIIRDEAYYFQPQGQTKIMNEGWASFWHSKIMTSHALTDADLITYADHHSGTMATSPQRLNPYKLGIELFKDIEERWNKGQFGPEWDACDDIHQMDTWDRQLGLGREKIFEVRRIHNDVTFIDTFLTAEFCAKHKMFSFAFNDATDYYEIASREFEKIKQQLLNSLTNHGQPCIRIVNGNYQNRGELYLLHDYNGVELKLDYARDTLVNLHRCWSRPVHIETVVEDEPTILSYDGESHEMKTKDE
ncbi:MAG: SpoVR family protein [Planctomycetaceae bacterium]|jgi:stage V sporulation protein R|nr:SpoVR family protein [Planctomycetaceae bacterium]MBT6156091.1 SpoVR family protein [Planctomycetaceae bacterium]MBT6485140.1 SpoVR family protein [Planctomycetaceae bacterium]MBT6494730.1 SpoVR family protein [Planctomycetaceae bacterium]